MTKRPPTEAVAATQEEIDEAIEALTPVQLVRLQKIAWLRHRALGRRAAGRHEGDLLSDALIAVLEGRRKWIRDNCDLVAFLAGVMRSIASHIRDGGSADAFDRLAANPRDERHNTGDSMDQMPMPKSDDLEHRLRAAELDGQIRDRFKDDPVVLLVYEALLDRMKPAEIRSCLDITENKYNASVKRLRRAVRGLAERRLR